MNQPIVRDRRFAFGSICGSIILLMSFVSIVRPVHAAAPTFPTNNYGSDADHIGNFTSYSHKGNTITIVAGPDKAKVIVCEPDLIRVAYGPGGVFVDSNFSYAVQKWSWSNITPTVEDRTKDLVITTDELYIRVWKNPVRFEFYDKNATLLNRDKFGLGQYSSDGTIEVNKFLPSDEHIYGLGEAVGNTLDHRGYQVVNWTYDSYNKKDGMGYKCFTLWLSNKGYGIFVDNFAKSVIDVGKSASDELWANFDGGKMEYYFFKGSMGDVINRYTQLTGRPYMAPKWAMGYQQCKWAFQTRAELEGIADTFRLKQFPCDVLWLDAPYRGWWKDNINWSGQFDARYPNPAEMIQGLHKNGFKLCLLENNTMDVVSPFYQAGVNNNYYVKNKDGSIFIGQEWNGDCASTDFTNPAAAAWFAGLHKGLADMGIDGWWIDMDDGGMPGWGNRTTSGWDDGYYDKVFAGGSGSKVHNCNGGLLDAQACYNYLKSYKPAQRPFYMTRGGASGMQRCAWTWSADLRFESWSDLQYQLRMEQNMGLCGVVYTSDIGGCDAPLNNNGEAYLRWLQAEVFNFYTRTHFNADNVASKYPWAYGATIEAHAKKWIEWKYRMLPYIYTAYYNYMQNGSPLHRALVYSYPNDSKVFNMADEFLFGDWMLVAPVVTGNNTSGASDTKRNVYLPAGTWIDYTDGKTTYTGAQTLSNYNAPLGVVPLFVKAGAILPMQPVMQYVGQTQASPITLDIYPGGSSSYTMYEDDGISFNYESGTFAKTTIECKAGSDISTVTVKARQGTYNPGARDYLIKMHLVTALNSVLVNGTALGSKTYSELSGGQNGWNYDAANNIAFARFADSATTMTVEFRHTATGVRPGGASIGVSRIDISNQGTIRAICDNAQKGFTLKMIDSRGKIVASLKGRGNGTIATGGLSAGLYMVVMEVEGRTMRKNMIVLKR